MLYFRRLVLPRLRFGLLLVSALLVLGLNQRTVSLLQAQAPAKTTRFAVPPRATVIKQKVTLEATASLAHFVAPAAAMWLPTPGRAAMWLPSLRRALACPALPDGIGAGAVFRARLLGAVVSPQAP